MVVQARMAVAVGPVILESIRQEIRAAIRAAVAAVVRTMTFVEIGGSAAVAVAVDMRNIYGGRG